MGAGRQQDAIAARPGLEQGRKGLPPAGRRGRTVALSAILGGMRALRNQVSGRLAALGRSSAEALGRRYGVYWRDSPESLFSVRVLPDGSFVYDGINPAHEQKTGLTPARLVGRTPQEALPPDVAAAVTRCYRRCVAAGIPITYAETLDLPGGRRQWETSLSPVRDRHGRVCLLLGSARDVTERARMQTALARSEQRFRTVTELVPDILFTAPPGELADYMSPRFFAFTGHLSSSSQEAVSAAIHPDDLARFLELSGSPAQQSIELEMRAMSAEGAYRRFLVRAERVAESDVARWYGVATDIEDVKRSVEQIEGLNDRLSAVLNGISDCYFTVGRDWRVTSANPRALEWFDASREQFIGFDLHQSPRLQLVQDAISHVLATGEPRHTEQPSRFHAGRWIEIHIYPVAEGASVFFRDITERRVAQSETEQTKHLLQGSLDAMSAQVALLDHTGVIIAVNSAWREAVGGEEESGHGLGRPYLDVCRSVMPELDEMRVARGLRSLLAGRRRSFSHPYIVTTPTGVQFGQLRINRFRQDDAVRLIAMHEDVTEAARMHAALLQTSERLLSIQEEERQRIAVELHDSTSQHLVALGLGLTRLRRTMDPDGDTEPVLDDMSFSVGEALKEIRVLTYLLNPPNLDRDGLETTVRRFASGFGARTGLSVAFRAEGELHAIRPAIQRAAFRVVQEALSNVHRHADAKGVEVDLARRGGTLTLRVADDGVGIGPLDLDEGDGAQLGVGIPGMRARVAQLGGELEISGDGAGTVVAATIPLREPRSWRDPDWATSGNRKVATTRAPHSGPVPSRAL